MALTNPWVPSDSLSSFLTAWGWRIGVRKQGRMQAKGENVCRVLSKVLSSTLDLSLTSNLGLGPWSCLWPELDLWPPSIHILNMVCVGVWLDADKKFTDTSRAPPPHILPVTPKASVRDSEASLLLPHPPTAQPIT